MKSWRIEQNQLYVTIQALPTKCSTAKMKRRTKIQNKAMRIILINIFYRRVKQYNQLSNEIKNEKRIQIFKRKNQTII